MSHTAYRSEFAKLSLLTRGASRRFRQFCRPYQDQAAKCSWCSRRLFFVFDFILDAKPQTRVPLRALPASVALRAPAVWLCGPSSCESCLARCHAIMSKSQHGHRAITLGIRSLRLDLAPQRIVATVLGACFSVIIIRLASFRNTCAIADALATCGAGYQR